VTADADTSTALGRVVAGPVRPARMLAAFADAAYLSVDAPVGVVTVTTSRAIALPNAAVLRGATPPWRDGDAAWVGRGRIVVGPLTIEPVAWWSPVPRLGRITPDELEAGIAAVAALVPAWPDPASPAASALATQGRRLATALSPGGARHPRVVGGQRGELTEIARRLVGLGGGLTPAGDDLLAATTAALRLLGAALGAPAAVATAGRLSAAVAPWRGRTTAVSAALLAQAARGAVAEPAAATLRALAGRQKPATALDQLVAAGHTSGHDLAVGLLLGARLALAHCAAGAFYAQQRPRPPVSDVDPVRDHHPPRRSARHQARPAAAAAASGANNAAATPGAVAGATARVSSVLAQSPASAFWTHQPRANSWLG